MRKMTAEEEEKNTVNVIRVKCSTTKYFCFYSDPQIFLVIDDHHVAQILAKLDFVLRNLEEVLRASKSSLVQAFKVKK